MEQIWQPRDMLGRYTLELCLSNSVIYYRSVVHIRWKRSKRVKSIWQYLQMQHEERSGAELHTRCLCLMEEKNLTASVVSLHTWGCCAAIYCR